MSLQITALLGAIITLVVAIYAFKKHQLTEKGTMAAMLVGISVFALGGWTWFAVLTVFFVTSSLLSKYQKRKKARLSKEHEKADIRDAWQVSANSLFPALLAAAYFIQPRPAIFTAFVASVATVAADTWATEVGILDKKTFSIIPGQKGVQGHSGTVSLTGLLAALVASVLVAVCAVALNALNNLLIARYPVEEVFAQQFIGGLPFIAVVSFSGFIGSLADSILGATLQSQYRCPKCRKKTERIVHSCGSNTVLKRGFAIIDNDGVNFLSSIFGAALAYGLALVFL